MRAAIAVCVFFFAALAVARPNEDQYTDKYDNVNLEDILGNRKLLEGYLNCILEEGKCTPDAKELKEHIIEALENECAKCNETQKKGTRRVIEHLINNEDAFWNRLKAKYDPDQKYVTKYEGELRKVKA